MGRTSVVPDDSTVGRRGSPADPEAYNEFRKRAISLFSEQIQRLQAYERGLASLELFCGDLKGLLDRAQLVPPSIFRGDNEGRFAATVKILKDVLSVCTADLAGPMRADDFIRAAWRERLSALKPCLDKLPLSADAPIALGIQTNLSQFLAQLSDKDTDWSRFKVGFSGIANKQPYKVFIDPDSFQGQSHLLKMNVASLGYINAPNARSLTSTVEWALYRVLDDRKADIRLTRQETTSWVTGQSKTFQTNVDEKAKKYLNPSFLEKGLFSDSERLRNGVPVENLGKVFALQVLDWVDGEVRESTMPPFPAVLIRCPHCAHPALLVVTKQTAFTSCLRCRNDCVTGHSSEDRKKQNNKDNISAFGGFALAIGILVLMVGGLVLFFTKNGHLLSIAKTVAIVCGAVGIPSLIAGKILSSKKSLQLAQTKKTYALPDEETANLTAIYRKSEALRLFSS